MKFIPQSAIPYIVLVGAFLYNLSIALINSYGNLSIYLTSYLRYKGNDVTYKSVSFIYELAVSTIPISMILGSYAQKKLGNKLTLFISCTGTFIAMYISSIYAHSYYTLCLFMGILYGIMHGISYPIPLSCAYKHFKNNRGLISGIVISGFSISIFLYCPLQTFIINKDNILPVLDGKKGDNAESGLSKSLEKTKKKESEIINMADYYTNLYKGRNFIFFIIYGPLSFFSNIIYKIRIRKGKYLNKKCTEDGLFYVLWMSIVLLNAYLNYIAMYWKIIGVTYTQVEDTIITLNGSLINSVTNIVGRLLWGMIYDKMSTNVTILLLGLLITASCFTLPAVAHIYPLFAICCGVLFFCIGGNLVTIPVITLKRYGEKYFTLNVSILYTSRIASTVLCSFVIKYLYEWLQLRYLSSAFGVLSMIATIVLFVIAIE
ncbi:hypothetical protein YYE_03398 [Plasmodium vinckei vinckei]|nr:hypothetical protein YYE_03398 [Plasmodium vinckei vinckei]